MLKSSLTKGKYLSAPMVNLPDDFDYYFPDPVRDWLGKYKITQGELRGNRIGYSELRESMILPVFGDYRELLMYQERYFGEDEKRSKYRTIGYKTDVLHLPDPWKHDTIVVVEDMISAIKVSRVTNCMPLFGNTLSIPVAMQLKKKFRKATIWLDANMKEQSVRTALTLGELGLAATVVFTDKDPKEYDTAVIRSMIDPLGKA